MTGSWGTAQDLEALEWADYCRRELKTDHFAIEMYGRRYQVHHTGGSYNNHTPLRNLGTEFMSSTNRICDYTTQHLPVFFLCITLAEDGYIGVKLTFLSKLFMLKQNQLPGGSGLCKFMNQNLCE